MDLPVYLPNLKDQSTKDYILRLLTENESLTNKQLHMRIRSRFSSPISYQAVRQALTELLEGGVLSKEGREYHISHTWIENFHSYGELLKKKYIDQREVRIIDEHTSEITLRSLNEMGNFLMHGFHERFFDMERSHDLFMYVHHLWFPFFDRSKRAKLDEFFANNKNLIFVKSKSFVDRVFAAYYRRYGKVKLGTKLDDFFDIVIQGDCVAKIHMPQELRRRMDVAYGKKNPFRFSVLEEFSDLTFSKYPIKIIITRDSLLATDLKKAMA